jgi:hypothetical protein
MEVAVPLRVTERALPGGRLRRAGHHNFLFTTEACWQTAGRKDFE